MGFSKSFLRRIALIVLLAVAGVRLADAHLHVCFDGLEPPVSVHALDASIHNDSHHDQAEHQDRDVTPFDAVLLKAGLDADVFVIAAALVSLPHVAAHVGHRLESLSPPPLRPVSQLKPPLRGPPL